MLYQNKFLWILFIFIISFSFINAELEKDNAINFAPYSVLEIDIMQSLNKDNKTGIEASVGKKVETGLFIELQDEYKIGLLETWFTFKPVK